MTQWGESPGSVRNQVGRSLNAIRDCVTAEDPYAIANHVRLLVALASPYLAGSRERESFTIGRPPPGEDEEVWLMERCMSVLEALLPVLADHGLYAYVSDDLGDARSLALGAAEAAADGA
jgi:hypothetical protein